MGLLIIIYAVGLIVLGINMIQKNKKNLKQGDQGFFEFLLSSEFIQVITEKCFDHFIFQLTFWFYPEFNEEASLALKLTYTE